jgi:hypothetical protein
MRNMRKLTYKEGLSASWFLVWRGIVAYILLLIALTIVLLPLRLLIHALDPEGIGLIVGFFVVPPATVLVTVPILLKMLLRKNFRKFRLEIVHPIEEESQPTSDEALEKKGQRDQSSAL